MKGEEIYKGTVGLPRVWIIDSLYLGEWPYLSLLIQLDSYNRSFFIGALRSILSSYAFTTPSFFD